MSFNRVILLGRLGVDPDLRYTPSQVPVGGFRMATTERRKDQSGNWVEHTEWHVIKLIGKTAENCHKFLKKGAEVFVEGRIQTRKWQDKEGKDRWTTEILGDNVRFVGGKARGGDSASMGESSSSEMGSYSSPAEVNAGKNLVSSLQSADSMASGSSANNSEDVPFSDDDIPF